MDSKHESKRMTDVTISIAKDFSPFPFGRKRNVSDSSAEEFREDLLVSKMRDYEKITIILDGVDDYMPSFLEESFGGLIRNHPFSLKDIQSRITFVSTNRPYLIEEIEVYLSAAEAIKNGGN